MRRKKYMFTGKSHSDQGKMAAVLGGISFVSMYFVIYTSYKQAGAMDPRLGAAAVFCFIFSIAGEVLSIRSRMEKDRFYLFPNLGIFLNSAVIITILYLLYIGVGGV